MPKKEENQLKKAAKKAGLKGKEKDAYIFGTLRKIGWKPKSKKNKK